MIQRDRQCWLVTVDIGISERLQFVVMTMSVLWQWRGGRSRAADKIFRGEVRGGSATWKFKKEIGLEKGNQQLNQLMRKVEEWSRGL